MMKKLSIVLGIVSSCLILSTIGTTELISENRKLREMNNKMDAQLKESTDSWKRFFRKIYI